MRYATELEAMQESLKDVNLQLPSTTIDHLKDTIRELGVGVDKMKAIVLEFEASATTTKDGQRDIRKFKWARKQSTISEVRDSVKRRRSHLSEAMIALQTLLGVDQR